MPVGRSLLSLLTRTRRGQPNLRLHGCMLRCCYFISMDLGVSHGDSKGSPLFLAAAATASEHGCGFLRNPVETSHLQARSTREVDFVIVGGGMAGAACAMYLATEGAPPHAHRFQHTPPAGC